MVVVTFKSTNQRERILALLIERGPQGVTNVEFNRDVCFRYGARIFELRRQGYRIETVRFGEGLFRFVYRGKSFHSSCAGVSSSTGIPALPRGVTKNAQIGLFAEAT